MFKARNELDGILDNLLNLEVNTIIKANLTASKFPGPRHALVEIARTYSAGLACLGYPLGHETRDGGFQSFHVIREKANTAIKWLEQEALHRTLTVDERAKFLMLQRFKDMSDQIKGVFNALKARKEEYWDNPYTHEQIEELRRPFPLMSSELVLIRKAWEIGDEEIALQTVIQLDGDVVTRVQPQYAKSGDFDKLFSLHNESVNVSLACWNQLVGIARDLASGLFNRFSLRG